MPPCVGHPWHLPAPRAYRGIAMPAVSIPRMWMLWWGPALSLERALAMTDLGCCTFDHTPAPQAVSVQPTPIFSPVCLLKLEFQHPSPHTHQQAHIWGLGEDQGSHDHLCWSLSVVPVAFWLLHSPLSLLGSLSVLADS